MRKTQEPSWFLGFLVCDFSGEEAFLRRQVRSSACLVLKWLGESDELRGELIGEVSDAELSAGVQPPREQLPAADGEGVVCSSRDMRPCGVPA